MASTPTGLRSQFVLVGALLALLLLDGQQPRAALSVSAQRGLPGGSLATLSSTDGDDLAVSPLETLVARDGDSPRRVLSLAPVRWLDDEGKWRDVDTRLVREADGGWSTASDRLDALFPARADGLHVVRPSSGGPRLGWRADRMELRGAFGGTWVLAQGPAPAPARAEPDGGLSYSTWPGVRERVASQPGLVKHDLVLEHLPPGAPGDALVLSWTLTLGVPDSLRDSANGLDGAGPFGLEEDGAGGLKIVDAAGEAMLWMPAPFLVSGLEGENLDALERPGRLDESDPAETGGDEALELEWQVVDIGDGLRIELSLPLGELASRADSFPLLIDPTVVDLSSPAGVFVVHAAGRLDLLGDRRGLAAGDFDGDGRLDLAIGVQRADGPGDLRPDAGEVHVLFGPLGEGSRDLATDKGDVVVLGADPFDTLGWAVAAGDLDGNGIDDLVMAAPFADGPNNTRSAAGEVHALLGPLPRGAFVDLAVQPGHLVLHGRSVSHRAGYALAVGDVTGDGRDEVLVGVPLSDGPDDLRERAGAVHVVSGPFPPFPGGRTVDLAVTASDAVVHGATAEDQLGVSLAAGDLDGDGLADLAMTSLSADGLDDLRPESGEIHVLLAPLPSGLVRDLALADADAAVFGRVTGDLTGHDLAVGDVSGDGVGDLIAGAHLADGPGGARDRGGAVIAVFGPFGGRGRRDLATEPADVVLHGAATRDLAGWSVAAGDVSGDGVADLLFSAVAADGPADSRPNCGEVHALLGPLASGTVLDLATMPTDVEVQGAQAADQFGHSLLVADLTGDGVGDLVAAAKTARGPGESRLAAGEAVVVPGRATGCRSDAECDDAVDCTVDDCDPATGECTNDDGPCNEPPACDPGLVPAVHCRELLLQGATVEDPDGDALEYVWVSSDPAVRVLPPSGSLASGAGPRELPQAVAVLDPVAACDREALLTLVVTDGRGGEGRCSLQVRFADEQAPTLLGVPADDRVPCDAVPPPAAVTASDACDEAPAVMLDELRVDGDCPGRYLLQRRWTATDRCGLSSEAFQVLEVVDEQAPVVEESDERVRCLWPPDHRMVHFDRSELGVNVADGCGGEVTWRFADCASNQPEDDTGDGSTEPDCVVDEDGAGFSVRAERSANRLVPRVYTVTVVATDACGNESDPAVVGTIGVSHDRGLRVGSGDCSGESRSRMR